MQPSLNDFLRAAGNGNTVGYVMRQDNGSLKTETTGAFGQWSVSPATSEINEQTRLDFFNALKSQFDAESVEQDFLREIGHELGVYLGEDAEGKQQAVVTNDTPLESRVIKSLAEKISAKTKDVLVAKLGIPSAEKLKELFPRNMSLQDIYAQIMNNPVTTRADLINLAAEINQAQINDFESSFIVTVMDKFNELGDTYHFNISDHVTATMEQLHKSLTDSHVNGKDISVIQNVDELKKQGNTILNERFEALKGMLAALSEKKTGFASAEAAELLKAHIVSHPDCTNPKVFELLVDSSKTLGSLLQLAFQKKKVSANSVISTAVKTLKKMDNLLDTLKNTNGVQGVDVSIMRKLAMAELKNSVDAQEVNPDNVKQIRDSLTKMKKDCNLVMDLIDGKIKATGIKFIGTDKAMADVRNAGAKLSAFLADLGIDVTSVKGRPSALSQEGETFIGELGVVRQYADFWDKEIEQKAGSLMLAEMKNQMNSALARGDDENLDTYEKIFQQIGSKSGDWTRGTTGLIFNGKLATPLGIPSYRMDFDGFFKTAKDFFDDDKTNGKRAARIIADFTHQGVFSLIEFGMMNTGEPCGKLNFLPIGNSMSHITRNADNSYDIDLDMTLRVHMVCDDNAEDPKTIYADAHKSFIKMAIPLHLQFGTDGKPSLEYREVPTLRMKCVRNPIQDEDQDQLPFVLAGRVPVEGFTPEDTKAYSNMKSSLVGSHILPSALFSDKFVKAVKGGKALEVFNTYKSIMPTTEQLRDLAIIGVNDNLHKLLDQDIDNTGKMVDRPFIEGLLKGDPKTLKDFQERCGRLVKNGYIDHIPTLNLKLPELFRKCNFDIFDENEYTYCDDYIMHCLLCSTDDPQIDTLCDDFLSDDVERQQKAQSIIDAYLTEGRRKIVGMKGVLGHQYQFNGAEIKALEQAPDDDKRRIDDLMEHVYAKDNQMTSSLQELRVLAHELPLKEYGIPNAETLKRWFPMDLSIQKKHEMLMTKANPTKAEKAQLVLDINQSRLNLLQAKLFSLAADKLNSLGEKSHLDLSARLPEILEEIQKGLTSGHDGQENRVIQSDEAMQQLGERIIDAQLAKINVK